MSEDSLATDNENDGFTKVVLLRKKHIRDLFLSHLTGERKKFQKNC